MRVRNYTCMSIRLAWLIALMVLALVLRNAFWGFHKWKLFNVQKELKGFHKWKLFNVQKELKVEDNFGYAIQDFTKMMRFLDILAVVIEPTIIYQLLDTHQKSLLQQRRFELQKHEKSEKIVNFCFLESDIKKFNYKLMSGLNEIRMKYVYWNDGRITKPNGTIGNSCSLMCHHFFASNGMLVHAIVFYRRGNYFWHCGLNTLRFPNGTHFPVTGNDLLFTGESSYESFTAMPAQAVGEETVTISIPSNPSEFLLQLEHSKFLECDPSRASSVKAGDKKKSQRYHVLKAAFIEALNEFKSQLRPQLIPFFIYGGTLLGWYRQCDIIPYTTDVDFGAWATDVGSEEFWISTFKNNPHVRLAEQMGIAEEAFELSFRTKGAKVDLFFLYENETLCWTYGHRPNKGYYFSYHYPKFKLCSADLLGQRVLVPCTPEKVIIADYGPNWREPARKWNYETNPKNMGPRLYWPKEKRPKVSKYFYHKL